MKKKKIKIAVLATLLSVVLLLASLTVYAYFTTKVYVYTENANGEVDKEVFHTGMQLQLLFDRLDSSLNNQDPIELPNYTVSNGVIVYSETVTIDTTKPWGSAQNPYVLSETRHLQNLAALQSVGYFDLMYLNENFTDGAYTGGVASIPYFVVCNSDGTPTTLGEIDKTIEIKPIGSAEHPFVGVIGGAFVEGTTTVGGTMNADGTITGGKTSSVSAIHNVNVKTNTNQTDVGLFGYVGFLGYELTPEDVKEAVEAKQEPQFAGVASSIQNILLSDVQIIVNAPTLGEIISELFSKVWETYFGDDGGYHRYTYTNVTDDETHPEETHHIGILAGHVSYAMIDNVNVYYSAENKLAFNLLGADLDKDNYYSASGILGMMYNMNCTVANVTNSDCVIKMGTGTSTEEIGSGGAGTGTGGGALSGNGRGYVTAAEIFSEFNNVAVKEDTNNELLWKYRLTENSAWVENAILVLKKSATEYTLADGKTAATVNGTTVSATINGKTASWTNFFVREAYESNSGEPMFRYKDPNGTIIDSCEIMGNKYNGETIWKFSAGGKGIWHYGIRVFKDADGNYTLESGTTVYLVNNQIVQKNGDEIVKTWDVFFITNHYGASYMIDASTGEEWSVTTFERKPMTLIEAYDSDGKMLCIEWERQRIFGGTEKTGLYYFYDGVFTFGLSNKDDTIRDTWKNGQVPTLYLGEDDDETWEVNPKRGNKALVSLLTPVNNNKDLDKAIQEGKQIYITSRPTSDSMQAYLMSLLTNNTNDNKPGTIYGQAIDLGDRLKKELCLAYQGGIYNQLPMAPNTLTGEAVMTVNGDKVTPDDLINENFWKNYTVLNVGSTYDGKTLDQLKAAYNIVAQQAKDSNGNKIYYYFRADTGAYVIPKEGAVSLYNAWKGYYYYTVDYKSDTEKDWFGWNEYEVKRTYTFKFYYQSPDGEVDYLGESTKVVEADRIAGGIGGGYQEIPALNYGLVDYDNFIEPSLDANGQQVTENGELMFVYTYRNEQNETITEMRPMINVSVNRFHGQDAQSETATSQAIVSGVYVSKAGNQSAPYFYYDVVEDEYRTSGGALICKGDELSLLEEYEEDNSGSILLQRYPAYKFGDVNNNDRSYLQILHYYQRQNIFGKYGSTYSIWSGSSTQYNQLDSELRGNSSPDGMLIFEDGQDYCYIQYTLDSINKYVGCDTEGGDIIFSGSATKEKLYVYIIEGVIDMDFGVNTFIPKEDSDFEEFSADSVVFWPQTTLKQQGVYGKGEDGKFAILDTSENATMATTKDPIYTIVPLTGDGGLNWGTKDGYTLGDYGLDKKFQMADQAKFGTLINIGDWSIPIGSTNTMVAPVGSNGVNATIPKGCVAFRVNSENAQTIRIIVAVPTTDMYVGSNGNQNGFDLDMNIDYYIGVWKVEAAGESLTSSFKKTSAVEKFELPRSYTFDFNDDPSTVEDSKPYTIVEYNGTQYRTYLNGDTFLVAYEFTVSGEGVYVIGSVHGDEQTTNTKDVPMEIVHFSVSGTASAGRDGVTGNQLGAIDFVYDDGRVDTNGNSIAHIITIGTTPTVADRPGANGEDYNKYYASQSLLYTDYEQQIGTATPPNYVKINQATVSVRRWLRQSGDNYETVISYNVTSNGTNQANAIRFKNYTINGDALIRNGSAQTD